LIIDDLNKTGALGAKLIGAGGGGYIMALVSKNKVNAVEKFLSTKNMSLIPINVDNLGAREY
jgi:mevalonate kinase